MNKSSLHFISFLGVTRNNLAVKDSSSDKKQNELVWSYDSASHSSLKPEKIMKNMSEGQKLKGKISVKSTSKNLANSIEKPPLVPKK